MLLNEPTFNGTGFIKVYLNPVTRLHIWSPKIPPTVNNSKIHDHRFRYVSQILIGEMEHTEWLFRQDGKGSHQMYTCFCHTDDREAKPAKILQARGNIEVWRKNTYKVGDHYEFGGPGRYHEIFCHDLTVAVMTRTYEEANYQPRMIAPYGEEPEHAFDTSKHPTVRKMKTEVNKVLRMLKA
jgi:hypothetical protein